MIITLFPLESHCFGYHVFPDLVVDIGFVGLAELVAARHTEHFPVFDEMGSSLVEAEGHAFCDALFSDGEDPVVVAGPCVHS